MSTTWQIESLATGTYTVTCWADGQEIGRGTYAEALAIYAGHVPTCLDCTGQRPLVDGINDVDVTVNLHTANAAMVAEMLGYSDQDPSDLYGSDTGEGFLAHVLTAIALDVTDPGVPAVVEANWCNGSRRPGRRQEILGELHDLAREAVRLGRDVTWS